MTFSKRKNICKIIYKKFFCNIKRRNILSLQKSLKRSTRIFFPERVNLFTTYSIIRQVLIFFRFSLCICLLKESYFFPFFHLSLEWTAFFVYYGTKFGIYPTLLANTGTNLSGILDFFLKNISNQMDVSPPNQGHNDTESILDYFTPRHRKTPRSNLMTIWFKLYQF